MKLYWNFLFLQLLQLDKSLPDLLFFFFSFVPALNPMLKLFLLKRNGFILFINEAFERDFYVIPIGRKFIELYLCFGHIRISIISSNFHKFEVGIVFVPEVEKGVDIGNFPCSPIHIYRPWIILLKPVRKVLVSFDALTVMAAITCSSCSELSSDSNSITCLC